VFTSRIREILLEILPYISIFQHINVALTRAFTFMPVADLLIHRFSWGEEKGGT
jgi:hypothetical protein